MGRPRKYTAKTLEREVKKYFDSITREVTVTELVDSGEYDQYGHMIRKPVPVLNRLGQEVRVTEYVVPPTAGDLCAFLHIDESTWNRYGDEEKYPEFCETVSRARGRMRDWNIHELLVREGKNIAGIKANLEMNYGYAQKREISIDAESRKAISLSGMTMEDKLQYLQELEVQVQM